MTINAGKFACRLYVGQGMNGTNTATRRTLPFTRHLSSKTSNSSENAKARLARAALKQVPQYGWTQDAITIAASNDPKLSISMSGMFSPTELVGWFMDDMNKQLRRKQEEKAFKDTPENSQFDAIQWRLQQVLPFVESGQWHKGMAMGLSTPLTTQSQLHEFIGMISPPGSSATYHTAMGAIFVATELHLLTDSSPNYSDTWSFLKARLTEVEDYKRQNGGVVDEKLLLQLGVSAFPGIPSLSSLGNMTNSISVVAGLAVAQSLVEGAASVLMPPSLSSPTVVSTSTTNEQSSMTGTKASDYEDPPLSSPSSNTPSTTTPKS